MDDLLFNNSTDRYIFTGSRLRAAPGTTLRLSTSANEAYIDLSSNRIVDISAAAVKINTSALSITGGGSFNVEGGLTLETGIQIGSGLYGGKIYKSANLYELVIDPFSLDSSNNISDASGQVTIMGDLVVRGNTTTFHSSNVDISDVLLTIAAGGATGNVDGAGIKLGIDGYASMLWNRTNDIWTFNKGITINQNMSNNNSLIIGGSLVTSNNSAKITNTYSSITLIKGSQLLSNVGTTNKNSWTDATGWTAMLSLSSQYSYTKIEARIAYTSSPEVGQTLSFRLLKYSASTSSYSIELFTDLSLGSNMGVSINNVHSILCYDTLNNGVTVLGANYKLQFMRNCTTTSTITIPFGIQESSGNFISIQELYRPLA